MRLIKLSKCWLEIILSNEVIQLHVTEKKIIQNVGVVYNVIPPMNNKNKVL